MSAQVTTQITGILAVGAWSGVATWVLLKLTDAMTGMRVGGEAEMEGLDTVEHNEKGYNL
jgi:Amt family ammonium transporter